MNSSLLFKSIAAMATFAVLSAAAEELTFDAAAGAISPPFVISTNGAISQPTQTSLTDGGRAVYTFTLATDGNYAVKADVKAPGKGSHGVYVNIDAEPKDPAMIWDVQLVAEFQQRFVGWRGEGTAERPQFSTQYFALTAGQHQLIVRGKEPGTEIQRFTIVRQPPAALPAPPTNLRVVSQQP